MDKTKTIQELETNYEWEQKYVELEKKIEIMLMEIDALIENTQFCYDKMTENLNIIKGTLESSINNKLF